MYNYSYSGANEGVAAVTAIISIAIVVLIIVAQWRIFTKAGEPGWKSLIPIYNGYTLYKICWEPKFFWIQFVLLLASAIPVIGVFAGIAAFVIVILVLNKLSNAFGKGAGFTVGLILLSPIFQMILAFGSAEYQNSKRSGSGAYDDDYASY